MVNEYQIHLRTSECVFPRDWLCCLNDQSFIQLVEGDVLTLQQRKHPSLPCSTTVTITHKNGGENSCKSQICGGITVIQPVSE